MVFGDAEWWEMVAATVAALHTEEGYPLAVSTAVPMFFQAFSQGKDGEALRAYLRAQPKPAAPPEQHLPGPVVADPCAGSVGWNLSDQLALVQCWHATLAPRGDVTRVFECTKRIAWALRGFGCGLLRKDGGSNIVSWRGMSFSASRVLFANGQMYKTMLDVPNGDPAWNLEDTPDMSMYVPALEPEAL